ncbi:phosphatidylserine/phosphatidylglycerophosphate/cardiolipin synthase family protein [Rhodobacter sp. NTK016B]|uniref:phospholipase D-like domain-containing protein n=1 Tax=Rhodobacter sp. NTK016B TaxID=2759676 RepID=UPI001A8F627E|nr:phosphatidylserine/phosphatidylglycerophosphate/cardiolipin synthase family protein [Rhodobacter sp. NTK016B]
MERGPAPRQVPQIAPPAEGAHVLSYLVLTEEGPAPGQGHSVFDTHGAARVSLTFLARGHGAYSLRATCNGPARVRQPDHGRANPAWAPAGVTLALRIEPGERHRSFLDIAPQTESCTLSVTPGGRAPWSLRLDATDRAAPAVAALDAALPACEGGGGADPLARAMMASGALSSTCPMPAGRTEFLADGADALNARVEALTGARLSRAALETGDPDLPLDYSNAPDLDLIYVNYLNINADFVGYLTARMLAWHAARGTIVRILVSDVMLAEADRALFEGLAARYPNVQLQLYRTPAADARGFEGQFARLHRVTHVKLFATIARQPGRSVAIVGGRNMHEGYFFEAPRDLSRFSFLHQYDPSQMRLTGGFTAYQDVELAFHDDTQVRAIVQHMGALWLRDTERQTMRPGIASGTAGPLREGAMRHFISVPYTDGAALERYYAGLLDAAQSRIRIASPYLNLPPMIGAALARARERGVEVDVVATVRVREVTDFMVSGLNRRFANRYADWVRFVDYDPMPSLLHAKLIVIDDRLVVAGSVNLNQRSFLHDLENGVVILDRRIAAQADRLVQSYLDGGEPVGTGQELSRWMRFFALFGFIERGF